jgi:hypothetical protein
LELQVDDGKMRLLQPLIGGRGWALPVVLAVAPLGRMSLPGQANLGAERQCSILEKQILDIAAFPPHATGAFG